MSDDAATVEETPASRCAAHPAVETYLRCGRCDTPICPRCLVMTPVGARCQTCARMKPLPMFELGPRDYLRGGLAALGAAVGGAALLTLLQAFMPGVGFFGLLLLLGLGYVTGEAASRATNRKRGPRLAALAALAVPFGLLLGRAGVVVFVSGSRMPFDAAIAAALQSLVASFIAFLAVLVAMAIAASRLR